LTSDNSDTAADVGLLSPAWAGTSVATATSDAAILRTFIDTEVALARAQSRLGLVPEAAADTIAVVAAELQLDTADIARRAQGGGNPVIPLLAELRAAVSAVDPAAAGYLHRGATSQDILDTALVLVARHAVQLISEDVSVAAAAIATLAEDHRDTIMAARTLTQQSLPTTFGLKAAGWLTALVDASRRVTLAVDRLPLQLGGAAGTLASFAELVTGSETSPGLSALQIVDELAGELGLRSPTLPWHTNRAPVTELADALTTLSDALGTIAADTALMSRTEIAEVHEPRSDGRGVSSAMPQKQNPVLSVLIQSAARKVPGLAAELHRSAIAVDERPDGAWHAEWATLRELIRLVGGASALAAELLPGLAVQPEQMLRNLALSGPLIVSERLMIVLAPILGRARVQQLVGQAANDPSSLPELLRVEEKLSAWTDAKLAGLLAPEHYLGAAQELIDRAIANYAETETGGEQR
jgi:3-carboxy-cis,cis-muconate cycloisomerase